MPAEVEHSSQTRSTCKRFSAAADIRGRIKSVPSDSPRPRQLFPIDRNLHNYRGNFFFFFQVAGLLVKVSCQQQIWGFSHPSAHLLPPPQAWSIQWQAEVLTATE